MFRPAHIHISTYLVKCAAGEVAPNSPEMDPRILAALLGGGVGAVGGGMVQLVRKLLQSRRDEEENGAPSIMRGILTGGLGGAALGAGAEHLARGAAVNSAPTELAKDLTIKQLREEPPVLNYRKAPITLNGLGINDAQNAVTAPPRFTRSGELRTVPSAPFQTMLGSDAGDPMLATIRGMNAGSLPPGITGLPKPAWSMPELNPFKLEAALKAQRDQQAQMEALAKSITQKSILSP